MRKVLFTLSLLLTIQWGLHAQKTVQGTVVYDYTVSGDGAEMMASMLPERMTVIYGKNAMLTSMEGGMMASMMGKIIVNKGESYVVRDDDKTIFLMSDEDLANSEQPEVKDLEKIEGESREILGYTCEAYRMKMIQNGQEMNQVVWATRALKAPVIDGAAAAGMNQGMAGLKDLDAFPMEVEIELAGMPMKMVLSVSELKMGKPDPGVFAKPKGYEQKPFSEMMKAIRN